MLQFSGKKLYAAITLIHIHDSLKVLPLLDNPLNIQTNHQSQRTLTLNVLPADQVKQCLFQPTNSESSVSDRPHRIATDCTLPIRIFG